MAAGQLHPLAAAVAPKYYGHTERTVVVDAEAHTTQTVEYLVLQNTTYGLER